MARESGSDSIRVNCVTPGLIGVDITAGKLTDEMKAKILEDIPLGRLGDADDVAGIYTFPASDLFPYVTGAVIDVNGGLLIHSTPPPRKKSMGTITKTISKPPPRPE